MKEGGTVASMDHSQVHIRLRQEGFWVDGTLLVIFWVVLTAYTVVILWERALLQLFAPPDWCPYAGTVRTYPNPDSSASDPCYYHATIYLLGLSPMDCDFSRRVLASILFGSAIGFERKAADRPAGIRTMSLVCLGACVFTMCSQFAFRASPQAWDAARVSAAVPSGVGFLGSALIWQETVGLKGTPHERHQVHGLTTAASVWLSASVGIGAGGALYLYCTWCVCLVIFVLRLGPRLALVNHDDAASNSQGGGDMSDWDTAATTEDPPTKGEGADVDGVMMGAKSPLEEDEKDPTPLTRQEQLAQLRQEAAAASGTPATRSRRVTLPALDPSTVRKSLRRKRDEFPAMTVSFRS